MLYINIGEAELYKLLFKQKLVCPVLRPSEPWYSQLLAGLLSP